MIIWIFWWLLLEIVNLLEFSVIAECSHHTCRITTRLCLIEISFLCEKISKICLQIREH